MTKQKNNLTSTCGYLENLFT